MSNEVDPAYRMAMEAIGMAAVIMTPNVDQYTALIKAERNMHSFLHITDPTMYHQAAGSKSLEQQVKLAKAAVAFIAAVQGIKSEIGEQGQ